MSHSALDFLNNKGPAVRYCESCGCRIPISSPQGKCRECIKKELFPKVKAFISDNYDVNEMILAQEFGIDKSIIHEWVDEGLLEYRNQQYF